MSVASNPVTALAERDDGNRGWLEDAKAGMAKYQSYIHDLLNPVQTSTPTVQLAWVDVWTGLLTITLVDVVAWRVSIILALTVSDRFPDSYTKLERFLKRGNCKCQDNGGNCCDGRNGCTTSALDETVRVYNIYPEEKEWGKFLVFTEYNSADIEDFTALQERLFNSAMSNEQEGDADVDEAHQESDDSNLPGKPCHVITVSHLSPNVVKLLGAKYDISADFFNRHLPGTEAISGRLISRLPSSVQIDFDELYESGEEFTTYWNHVETGDQITEEGHQIIDDAIRDHFLFRVGWDYFPVKTGDWLDSINNIALKSGYEVLLRDDDKLKNVFQFNLNHRISVYSRPPKHPRTVIIIFYPTLPIHRPPPKAKGQRGSHPDLNGHAAPSGIVEASNIPASEFCQIHGQRRILFRSIPNIIPTPLELGRIVGDPDTENWESLRSKQSYASAYDINFKLHLKDHLANRHKKNKTARGERDMLIHLFGAPLFKAVSANWARLIVRRSFDLDLLEWRGKNRMDSRIVEEIKSRRIAISRHQRDINTSLEVLRGLAVAERGSGVRAYETISEWNMGRSNGLIAEAADEDSWERIFWDFFELKSSMDALETRANKIQDGIVGLIRVYGGEQSEISNRHAKSLNVAAFFFSIVILPFTIVGPIFGTDYHHGGPNKTVSNLVRATLAAFGAVTFVMFLLLCFLNLYEDDDDHSPKWAKRIKRLCRDTKKILERDPDNISVAEKLISEEKKFSQDLFGPVRRFVGSRSRGTRSNVEP